MELSKADFLRYLKKSRPHTREYIEHWNEVYKEFNAERCERCVSLYKVEAHNLIMHVNRYTACVNLTILDSYVVHICNFIPIIIGSTLDQSIRDIYSADRLSCVFMFNNFWSFSSFINTNSRLCHIYYNNNTKMQKNIRMYIYDRRNHGNMLFLLDEQSPKLYIRDRFKREYELYDDSVGQLADNVSSYALDLLFDAKWSENFTNEQFLGSIVAYMRMIGNTNRDIDDMSNKCICCVQGLYVKLLNSLINSLTYVMQTNNNSSNDNDEQEIEVMLKIQEMITKYTYFSHKANLLNFISRKTNIKYESGEIMKLQLKNEIKYKNFNHTQLYSAKNSEFNGREKNKLYFRAMDVTHDMSTVKQHFYCGKTHSDCEYDNELVKRMKVVNLNAIKCLMMPLGFVRFFSFFNIGSISSAGRFMNKTVLSRESFHINIERTVRYVCELVEYYEKRFHITDSTMKNIILINEIPSYILMGKLNFWQLFIWLKIHVDRITLQYNEHQNEKFVNLSILNGIMLVPTNVIYNNKNNTNHNLIEYCEKCREYRFVSSLRISLPIFERQILEDDYYAARYCSRHIFFSREELQLYYKSDCEIPNPYLFEVCCHGALSITHRQTNTEIGKMIVAINAYKRKLSILENPEDLFEIARRIDRNTKTTLIRNDGTYYTRDGCVKLFYIFGDYDMLNCEDGYIMNEHYATSCSTIFNKKLSYEIARDSIMYFDCSFKININRGNGLRVHICTLYSYDPIIFRQNGNFNFSIDETVDRERRNAIRIYNIYFLWNTSYLNNYDQMRYYAIKSFDRLSTVVTPLSIVRRIRYGGHILENPPLETIINNNNDNNNFIYEYEVRYDRCSCVIERIDFQISRQNFQISLFVTNVRQTLKIQNSYGQKGLAQYGNIDHLVGEHGENIHIIASQYSIIGRAAYGQFKHFKRNAVRVFDRNTGHCVGWGAYDMFFFSNDSSHNNFIFNVKKGGENPMRMCKLTYESFIENELSSAAYVKACEFESSNSNPYSGISRAMLNALDCYAVYERRIEFRKSQKLTHLRKKILNATIVNDMKLQNLSKRCRKNIR